MISSNSKTRDGLHSYAQLSLVGTSERYGIADLSLYISQL